MQLFSTSGETIFMGWDGPLLPRAAGWLGERFESANRWDLGGLICVLPSAQSVSRLGELMTEQASRQNWTLKMPEIITIGELPELLYQPAQPLALEFEQTLAWARVLQATDADELRKLLSILPAPEPLGPWLELAGTVRRLYEDLASSHVTFLDVMAIAETEPERNRWQLLDRLWNAYLSQLHQADRADPYHSRQNASVRGHVQTDKTVVLIGTADLNESQRVMLRALESEVIALVAAPANQRHAFDELGCVDTPSWLDAMLPIEDEHLIPAGDIADQASAVAEVVAEFSQRHGQSEISVGTTDATQVAPTELQLSGCSVPTFRHIGWTVSQTAIGRLLDLTATFLQRRSWQSLAALIRHSDVYAYVSANGPAAPSQKTTKRPESDTEWFSDDWTADIDRLLSEHHPILIDDTLPEKAMANHGRAKAIADCVSDWLGPLSQGQGKAASKAKRKTPDRVETIGRWSEIVSNFLTDVYFGAHATEPPPSEDATSDDPRRDSPSSLGEPLDHLAQTRHRTAAALNAVLQRLSRFAKLSPALDVEVTGAVALEMLSQRLSDLRITDQRESDSLEIHGWLDLALNDSPALVVLGFNHPFVPAAVTSDPFLPGSLRSRLNMPDNDRRYARDAYATQVMISSRSDVRFIVGRNSADGSPTPPSRLLSASSPDDLARRITLLLEGNRRLTDVTHRWDVENPSTQLPVPSIQVDECPIASMSVTAFRDYLACPYRFYLRHVLKMKPLDDSMSELAANQFGDLVHGSLESYGLSGDKDETDPKRIEALMLEHLDAFVAEHYGDAVTSAVRLQIRQAQRRLKLVAQAQAKRIGEGWIIHGTEMSVGDEQGAQIVVDDRTMGIRGRFDRIDYHPERKQWAILDYKTHNHKPEKKHLKKVDGKYRWIDLQLPLYRMMIPFLGIDAPPQEVQLGYFNVGENQKGTGINIAKFSEELMQDAEKLIHDCIRGIHDFRFEPTVDPVQYDDYEMILQTNASARLLSDDESGNLDAIGRLELSGK